MSPEPLLGPDGELFEAFVDTSITESQQLNIKETELNENKKEKQQVLLALMKKWKDQKPEKGMTKPYFQLGKGDNELVICTTPIHNSADAAFFKYQYLAVAKDTFYLIEPIERMLLHKVNNDTSIFRILLSPFKELPLSIDSNRDYRSNRAISFQNQLRGYSTKGIKWTVDKESTVINILNNNNNNIISHFAKLVPIDTQQALEVHQEIQGNISKLCLQRIQIAARLSQQMSKDTSDIASSFGIILRKKKK